MQLSYGARRLFKLIENFIRKSRRAFRASQRWVADHFGVSLRTVKYWYAELRDQGVFAVTRRPNRSSEIVILKAVSAPPLAPPVALPTYEPSVVNLSGERRQHHRDDAASPVSEAVRKASGRETLTEGERRWCTDLERSGVTPEVARAGVVLARARRANSSVSGPIHSARYFTGAIAEARETLGTDKLPLGYINHLEKRLPVYEARRMAASA